MGPRHNLLFCACKTACLAPELLVSIGPFPHLWFLHAKQGLLGQTYKSVRVRPHLWFLAHITACLEQDYHHYMGSSPHLWFCACKQRLLDHTYKSVWVPDLICGFVHT